MGAGAIFAVVIGVLAVSVIGGWYVTRGVLALAARNTTDTPPAQPAPGETPAAPAGQTPDAGPNSLRARAALRGGTWIGILERLAITALILVNYPTGVAILVAVKGLGRYPELRDNPEASERFVIGTLASMLWAGALGLLGRWAITAG